MFLINVCSNLLVAVESQQPPQVFHNSSAIALIQFVCSYFDTAIVKC
ncbi:MAG: hypothetical protein V7K90_04300 [Nostoc sp.]